MASRDFLVKQAPPYYAHIAQKQKPRPRISILGGLVSLVYLLLIASDRRE
jgi:hypothetical protein